MKMMRGDFNRCTVSWFIVSQSLRFCTFELFRIGKN